MKKYNNITLLPALLILSLMCCLTGKAQEQDSLPFYLPQANDKIFFIGHINTDAAKDTVIGAITRERQYVPKSIHWGRPAGAKVTDRMPALPVSFIVFPKLKDFHCSIAFERLSADTLYDLIMYFTGKVKRGSEEEDIFRSVALFGQTGIDSIPFIEPFTIDSVQDSPYYAQRLMPNRELAAPAIRDVSGKVSYILPKIRTTTPRDTTREPEKLTGKWSVDLAPNPATTSIKLSMHGLEPGLYTADILTLQGVICRTIELRVVSEATEQVIALDQLASGYYMIILRKDGFRTGPYPFVTIH